MQKTYQRNTQENNQFYLFILLPFKQDIVRTLITILTLEQYGISNHTRDFLYAFVQDDKFYQVTNNFNWERISFLKDFCQICSKYRKNNKLSFLKSYFCILRHFRSQITPFYQQDLQSCDMTVLHMQISSIRVQNL